MPTNAAGCAGDFAVSGRALWRRLDCEGREEARVDGTTLIGAAVFAHGAIPCGLAYVVVCDDAWRTREATVRGFAGERTIEVRILVDGPRWLMNGVEVPSVRGCADLDFNFSPSTNLLPIRRVGEGAVTAAWLRFPSFELQPLEQSYARIGERTYRYTSATGFTANIEVDECGLVLRYPGFCEPA